MYMERREFLKSAVAVSAVGMITLTETGCSQTQMAQLTQVLGTDATNLATALGQSAIAAQLQTATTDAVTAINNWKSGTSAQYVIQALGVLEVVLNLIPLAGPYAPLIDLVLGTVQSLLALLPAPTTMSVSHIRMVRLGHPAPKTAKEFTKQWNAIVDTRDDLAVFKDKH
jgi:hypothetical protein